MISTPARHFSGRSPFGTDSNATLWAGFALVGPGHRVYFAGDTAMFGGFGGSFFATRQGFISPESFTFIESAIILAIVVLGGMGSQIGVVFAAIILIGMPEIFRDLQQFRMLFFGGAMVLIMLWRPSGLLAHREPTIRMPDTARSPAAGAAE